MTRTLQWMYLMGTAFATTIVVVPAVRRYALWRGILDVPSSRKVHAMATPLLGGVAVFAGFAATVLANFRGIQARVKYAEAFQSIRLLLNL